MPTLIGEKRQGDMTISLRDGQRVYECMYYYTIRGDAKTDSRKYIAENTTGLPVVGLSTDDDNTGLCSSLRVDRRPDNPIIWDATARFESLIEQGNSLASGADPIAWIPRRKTIFFNKQEVSPTDATGAAYVNSAGDHLTGVQPRMRTLVGWRFIQFEAATVTDETIADRNETVNASTYKGRAAKTLLLTVEDSEVGTFYGLPLRLTQYLLKYDPLNWRSKYLDVGWNIKSAGVKKPYMIDGVHVEGALNGSGAATNSSPSILSFDDYPTSTFSFLRI